MEKNEWEKKNTVAGDGQVSKYVTFEGSANGSPKIMFVGNSITRHAPLAEIGWHNNWGMAASAKENDYVHKIISAVTKKHPNASFCIVQASVWERSYTEKRFDEWFGDVNAFCPDIIFCAISGNIEPSLFDKDAYIENINALLTYLAGENKDVKIFHTSSFFGNTKKNEAIEEYTKKFGATYVPISDIKDDESNLAIGLFEHKGIQVHPGDKGMAELANRFLSAAKDLI